MKKHNLFALAALPLLALSVQNALAACSDVHRNDVIAEATSVVSGGNGGLAFSMWVTVVDEAGTVCHVVNTNGEGTNSNAAWLGSRVISAQKANAANAFSHDGLALSTANLYSAVQPGGSLTACSTATRWMRRRRMPAIRPSSAPRPIPWWASASAV